jgi:energy-coupling factor transporter transmembrane protein EcfT
MVFGFHRTGWFIFRFGACAALLVSGISYLVARDLLASLRAETARIREAISARGVRFRWTNAGLVYRALFIPFIARLIDISDVLALSIEIRGFSAKTKPTVYKPVRWTLRDLMLFLALCSLLAGTLTYRLAAGGTI